MPVHTANSLFCSARTALTGFMIYGIRKVSLAKYRPIVQTYLASRRSAR